MLLHEPAEHPLGEAEQLHVGVGRHGRRARTAVEERDLTEEFAGLDRALLAAADRDRRRALGDDEQPDPGLALAGDLGAGLVTDLAHGPCDGPQLALRAVREHRDLAQLRCDLLNSHGVTSFARSRPR